MSNAKKKNPGHQTQSFAQLMSQAQLKALQPYVQQLVAQQFEQASRAIYQFVMSERSMMQTRQLAFERLLAANCPWFNDDLLALTVATVEDEAGGMVEVHDGAKEGDKVRLELWAKKDGKDAWEQDRGNKLAIHSLGSKGPNGTVQTQEDLETAVLGMRAGEGKEFLIANPANEDGTVDSTRVKVIVIRVSREKAKTEATANV